MRKLGLGLGLVSLLNSAVVFAADTPFEVTPPTFDWSDLGTIATSMLLVAVGMAIFRRAKAVMR